MKPFSSTELALENLKTNFNFKKKASLILHASNINKIELRQIYYKCTSTFYDTNCWSDSLTKSYSRRKLKNYQSNRLKSLK